MQSDSLSEARREASFFDESTFHRLIKDEMEGSLEAQCHSFFPRRAQSAGGFHWKKACIEEKEKSSEGQCWLI